MSPDAWQPFLDQELAPLVTRLPRADLSDPVAARAAAAALPRAVIAPTARERAIEHRDLRRTSEHPGLRVYRAADDAQRPGVLWLHGGGFVRGSVEIDDPLARRVAAAAGAVVVSVEYRLAPEHRCPAALEDAYAGLAWMVGHAAELSLDRGRVAVAGYSAGGGLAAGVAVMARDRGGPDVHFQALGTPVLDDRLATPSMRAFTDTPLWDRGLAAQSWRHYLGDADGAEVPPEAVPARVANLAHLPPAYVSTAAYDPLRDEGIAYACRLLEAAVPTELHQYPGTVHGSHLFLGTAVGARQSAEFADALTRALARPVDERGAP